MTSKHGIVLGFVVASLTAVVAEGGVTLVSGGGFSLQNAVATAASGDVLVVASGVYYSPIVVQGKGLSIVAASTAGFKLDAGCFSNQVFVRVENVPANESVLLAGAKVESCGETGSVGIVVKGTSTSGPTRIEDCYVTGAQLGIQIDGCRATIVRTTILGSTEFLSLAVPGGRGLLAVNASLDVHGCEFVGGNGSGGSTHATAGAAGGQGGRLTSSFLTATATEFVGGNGGAAGVTSAPGAGGAGLFLEQGSSVVATAITLTGGAGGFVFPIGSGPAGSPLVVDGASTYQTTNDAPRSITITSPAKEHTTVQFDYVGAANDLVAIAVSPTMGFASLPQFGTALGIGAPFLVVAIGVAPSGTLSIPATLPALSPGVVGLLAHLQGVGQKSGGGTFLTNPTSFLVVDA